MPRKISISWPETDAPFVGAAWVIGGVALLLTIMYCALFQPPEFRSPGLKPSHGLPVEQHLKACGAG